MKETVAGYKNVQEKVLQAFKNGQKTSLSVTFSSEGLQISTFCKIIWNSIESVIIG